MLKVESFNSNVDYRPGYGKAVMEEFFEYRRTHKSSSRAEQEHVREIIESHMLGMYPTIMELN